MYTILGGMLSVLVTDFLQFVVMSAGLLAVTILVLYKVGWTAMVSAVEAHHGAGGFNPFLHQDVGWPYVLFNLLLNFGVVLTWQTIIQRVLASKDSKTARKIYTRTSFFFVCRFIIPGLWGIAALAVISPEQLAGLLTFHERDVLDPGQIADRTAMLAMPHLLSTIVPAGLMGILIAAMLAADMSTDSSYMLTWGGIIYNDILAPIRKNWSEKRGLLWNRIIIALIGIFLLVYGLWYPIKGDLWSYFCVTSTIYVSSISVLLIACCYWKGANNWGAGAAIFFGAAVPILFLVLQQIPETEHFANETVGPNYSGILAFVLTAAAMIIGSQAKNILIGHQKGDVQ